MPKHYHIIDLPDLRIRKISGNKHIEVYASLRRRPPCIRCGAKGCRIKSSFDRRIRHSRQGNRFVFVNLRSHKFYCKRCNRFFNLRIQGLLPHKRSSETYRYDVFERHNGGITQKQLAQTHKVGTATVERWYQDFIRTRNQELRARPCPKVLGIDEHFFTRKQGYATTLVDIRNRKVFDVVLGRSESNLGSYLSRLEGRHYVRVVVMDMAETYRSLIRKFFPNAVIVSDRFHVVKLVNHHFLRAWQQLDPTGRKNRGLLSLMRRHPWNLDPEQVIKLRQYLKKHPTLESIYDFKNELMQLVLLKNVSKAQARVSLFEFLSKIEQLSDCPIESLQTLGKTLRQWSEEILRMWRMPYSNAITEGFHNKMEMISRRAFGFRNFQNYRMRVLALCGWNGVINRAC